MMKNKKGIRYLVIEGLLFFLAPLVLGYQLERITTDMNYMLWFAMRWNVIIMYVLEIIVLFCTLSVKWSVVAVNVFLTIVYSANYFVYSFRGVPLRLSDLTAVRTAAKVVGNYSLAPTAQMVKCWVILLCIVVLAFLPGKTVWHKSRKVHLGTAVAGVVLALVCGHVFIGTDFLVSQGFIVNSGFIQPIHFNGYLVSSCLDIQSLKVKAPEGYSAEAVDRLLKAVEEEKVMAETVEEELPHIILILNESFSDLRVLGNLELSEENMPFFNSLEDNTIRGYVNASVLGGGTANTEFEVLTGCSMGFLPDSYYPYQQSLLKKIPSMVSMVQEMGYGTYSIHPENKSNWNRENIYQYLGFENSFWMEDFEGAEIINNGVSDLETYFKIEELYENRQSGEHLFIFDITMQNHGGYTYTEMEPTVTALNTSYRDADIYLSLVKESDKAFEQLVTYFEQQDEKVLICMFGDHQPKLGSDEFYQSIYDSTENLTEQDKLMNLYKTPFVIWANYDIPEEKDLDISMNYLGGLVLETAGIPQSAFFTYLSRLREEYPIITTNGYVDAQGNYSAWSGEGTEFPEYRILQYYYLYEN